MSLHRAAWALSLLLGLAGCTGGATPDDTAPEDPAPVIVQPGAPGQPGRTLDPEAVATVGGVPHAPADVTFAHAMIAHHEQALELAGLVGDRTGREDVTLLAERIALSQADEIARLEGWLEARGEPLTAGHDHGTAPGMLTPAQLTALAGTTGAAFDRGFLEAMIGHHEGALVMVANLFAAGGGQEAEISQLASDVEADQRLEIDRMREMLAGPPDPMPPR